MRILVVAEIRLYRDGVADALRAMPDVDCAVTSARGAPAVVTARRHECDVAILDMTMPGSIQTSAALLAARPGLKVVALGAPEDAPTVVACAEAGVHGYASRDATLEELADVLRAAMRGEAVCSGRIGATLLAHIASQARRNGANPASHRVPNKAPQLTRREREILRLLQTEMSNKEIARALDLQLSTVKNHVHNLLAKLGASGRSELASLRLPAGH